VGGLAATAGLLIGMRAAQRLGAAVLAPATLTILTATFAEGPVRTQALAIWTAVSSAGNLIGGVLTQSLSWRWILLINVPIGAAAVLAALHLLPADRFRTQAGKLDLPGAGLATLGVTALVYGVAQAQDHGWSGPTTLTGLAVGVLTLAVFAVTEVRYAAAPLVPPGLVRMGVVPLVAVLQTKVMNPQGRQQTPGQLSRRHPVRLDTAGHGLSHNLVQLIQLARILLFVGPERKASSRNSSGSLPEAIPASVATSWPWIFRSVTERTSR
jgi:hypothetical protein